MTKNSGIQGKTMPQALRSIEASKRKALRDSRTSAEQLEILGTRPGQSRRERARLNNEGNVK